MNIKNIITTAHAALEANPNLGIADLTGKPLIGGSLSAVEVFLHCLDQGNQCVRDLVGVPVTGIKNTSIRALATEVLPYLPEDSDEKGLEYLSKIKQNMLGI